jgi:hypothetical protein
MGRPSLKEIINRVEHESKANKGKTSQMQQMMIYWQSVIPQHVSGVFTPIIRKADCMSLSKVFCSGCGCCGSGEAGNEMDEL